MVAQDADGRADAPTRSAPLFDAPMTVHEATTAVEGWLATPVAVFLRPDPDHLATGLTLLNPVA